MNILGIDTSAPACAVGVLREDGEEFDLRALPSVLEGPPRHTLELMPAVERCLRQAALGYADIGAVAVGIGPGAFTGLRIGVATARALAFAHGAQLRPVSSLRALSAGIGSVHRAPVLDAGRGEVFAAVYEGPDERLPPFSAPPEKAAARVLERAPGALAAGGGSVRFRKVLEGSGLAVEPAGSEAHLVSAVALCRLAAAVSPAAAETVLPDYLRLPDATPR